MGAQTMFKPMFTIANQIAYNNKMVLPSNITKVGKTGC